MAARGGGDLTETLWLHGQPPSDPEALASLAQRLRQTFPEFALAATGTAAPGSDAVDAGLGSAQHGPGRAALRTFLDQVRPDAAIFCGRLAPLPAQEVARREIPSIWVDAVPAPQRRLSFLLRSGALPDCFTHVLTAPGPEAERLQRERGLNGRLETPGFLRPELAPPPCPMALRDEVAGLLGARPTWLAVTPHPDEIAPILDAHRSAAQMSHRLLLILAVDEDSGAPVAEAARQAGWITALRSDGGEPESDVQVYVADDLDELGLWYRLASITLLGGTLVEDGTPRHPFEPASLGSVLLTGRHTRPHDAAIARLGEAGALIRVSGAPSLGRAVTQVLSPDVAADKAAAAWRVVTDGAPALNRTVELVEELLYRTEPR